MSWNRNAIALVSDPCQATKYGFTFATGRSPAVRFGADIYAEVETPLADGSARIIKLADPLRTGELHVTNWMTRLELMNWRIFREYGHYCAIFPNYWTDTCIVTHFEDSLTSEIGTSPTMLDASDATATATYEAGKCGGAVTIVDGCYLAYPVTLPLTGSLAFWFKMPASGDLTTMGFFRGYTGTPHFEIRWNATAGDLGFRYAGVSDAAWLSFGRTGAGRYVAAGSWHHIAIAWDIADPTITAYAWWDGALTDSTVTDDFTVPTMSSFRIGQATTDDMGTTAIDEVRLDPAVASSASVAAQYDRLNEEDERVIQEQTQGHYFRLSQGSFDPKTLQEGGKWTGAIAFTGRWSDPGQRVSRASVA